MKAAGTAVQIRLHSPSRSHCLTHPRHQTAWGAGGDPAASSDWHITGIRAASESSGSARVPQARDPSPVIPMLTSICHASAIGHVSAYNMLMI